MPILYHPQASYEFYIAPGSTSVNITAAIFNVGGVTLDTETKAQSISGSWPASVWRIQDGQTFADDYGATYDFDDYSSITREMFNVSAYEPTIVSKPKTAAEVVEVLNYCVSNGLAFKVKSGTHSYAGEGIGAGVVIDMKLLNGATLDAANQWIDVEGGALQWQPNAALNYQVATTGATSAYDETNETQYNNVKVGATDNPPGYWTPMGSGPYVGWTSVSTSGGISIYPNRLGLMCDLFLEADIIVGKAGGGFELVTATPTNEHADLLDGIRGIGNSTLGIITRLRSKVFTRKQAFTTRVGLSWRPGNASNGDFRQNDANLWGITAGTTAGGWTAAHTSDEWKFGKHLYETYQETLMGGETYGAGHTLAGKPIWPHGITNGVDGTYYMWSNYKYPSQGWDDYSITYHFQLDSFQGEQNLVGGNIPEQQYYLAKTIIDRTIAKDSSRYARFSAGTENGSAVNAIRFASTTATADQGVNSWDPSESGPFAKNTQTSGIQDTTYSLNGALAIPTTESGATAHANVAESNFDFYRDIFTDINPGLTYNSGTGRQGIYYRWYTHSTTPDGPIASPPHGISQNTQKDTLGWRDRPNEIQMFDQAWALNGITYSDLFNTSSGANQGTLTPLGKQFQRRRVTWFNEMIAEYGGNDPRSYIGYLDPLAKKYQTPNGSTLDINRFYYGPTGVSNISALKTTYDPNSKFTTGPVIKDIDIVTPPEWEAFSVAKLEIDALSAGATIDFGTRKFAATYADHESNGISLSKSVGISGGRFSLGKTASWSSIGGGVYAADHDFSPYRSIMGFISDENAVEKPLMAVSNLPDSDMNNYRFCYGGHFFTVNNTTKGINNGVVHTVAGDNAADSMTGWTITDSTLKSQVNALLSGVTAGPTAGPWVLMHSSSNRVNAARISGWNNTSGGLSLAAFGDSTIMDYSGSYLEFNICGLPGQTLQNGEYAFDVTNGVTAGRVLYKPTNGDASDARIPVTDFCFKISGAGNTYTFDGVTLECQSRISDSSGMIRDALPGFSACDISNCTFTDGSNFFRTNYGRLNIDKCSLTRSIGRAGTLRDGTTMTNNVIDHVESESGFLIQCDDVADNTIQHTYVADNVFSLEASTHGQGLSLYKDAWRNATVVHNIFYNCQRAHSFQPGTTQKLYTQAYDYKFENNLVVVDKVLDIQGFVPGQKTFSFNGARDTGLSGSNLAQGVRVRNNTFILTDLVPYTFTTTNRSQLTSIDLQKLEHSRVMVENNISATTTSSEFTTNNAMNSGQTHANNLNYRYSSSNAISITDKLVHSDRNDYLEPNSFRGKTVAGGAADGGVLGVRWSVIPTSTQIQNIITNNDVNWASTYPALTLPAGGSYSNALEETQEYGLTGGGTGDMGAWRSSLSTYKSSTGTIVFASGSNVMGVSGFFPGDHQAYCSPAYSGSGWPAFTWTFGGDTAGGDTDLFREGMSGDYFRLQVTVTKGGSGNNSAGGYYAGNTGQVYNYYWAPNKVSEFTSSTLRWSTSDLQAQSDEWPNSGITGSLWGDNALYSLSFQPTAFPDPNTYTFTYSITHDNYGD
jgi:hypothetical protein